MGKGKIGLLIAAAAAYGIYKYSKLTPEQKKDLMAKGKDFFNKKLGFLPGKDAAPAPGASMGTNF